MLRIEIRKTASGWWFWDTYSANGRRILLSTLTSRKSTAVKTAKSFIRTTGMTVVTHRFHRDGTETIIIGNDAYVKEHFSN